MARLATNKNVWMGMRRVHDKRVWIDNGYSKVRVGQVWQNWDSRTRRIARVSGWGRFRVIALMYNCGEFYAVVDRGGYRSLQGKEMNSRAVCIKIRRLRHNSRGYRLLEDA